MKTKQRMKRYVIFHPLTGKFFKKLDFSSFNYGLQNYQAIFVSDINDAEIHTKYAGSVNLSIFTRHIVLDKENNNITYYVKDLELRLIEISYKMLP